jgi:Ca2+-binding RTX toxin-like protein
LELRLGGGADFLSVRGSSSVFGEAGDDDFILFGAMSAATSGVVDGGEGTDRLTLSTGFTFDLATGIARGGDATYAVSGFERFIATTNGATSTILGNDAANSFEVSFFGNDGRAGVVFDGRGGADSLSGSVGADTLSGGDGNDSIDGRAGDDLIDGGLGNDFMIGGAGNDTYVVSSFDDRVNEFAGAGEGEDEVVTALQGYYLPFAVERLTLIGAGNLLGVGNALNNRLTGNAGANELYGLDGADVVLGLAGADTLGGGAGDDRIEGGSDGDFLYGDAGRDQLDGGDGLDMLYGGEGDDILQGGAGADLMLGAAGARKGRRRHRPCGGVGQLHAFEQRRGAHASRSGRNRRDGQCRGE